MYIKRDGLVVLVFSGANFVPVPEMPMQVGNQTVCRRNSQLVVRTLLGSSNQRQFKHRILSLESGGRISHVYGGNVGAVEGFKQARTIMQSTRGERQVHALRKAGLSHLQRLILTTMAPQHKYASAA